MRIRVICLRHSPYMDYDFGTVKYHIYRIKRVKLKIQFQKVMLTEHEKEQARETALEVVKTILTLGFNHLIRWIGSLIKK